MNSIRVSLKDHSYDIRFGSALSLFPSTVKKLGFLHSRLFVVTTRGVEKAGHLKRLQGSLKKNGFNIHVVVLPDGEEHKNITTLQRLYEEGFKANLDRKSLVVALGGGVITDLAGFFAATYMRGVPYVSIPTTLLAMVDAAIGGKTGIDMPQGKNLVGAFWQPRLVWIDASLLKTLPARQWKTGFAEILKYGVIKKPAFFDWLETHLHQQTDFPKWSTGDVLHAIYQSALTKAQVVSGDERERPLAGGREILNFGHTVGHALEAAKGYRALSHGEAISIGMNMAGRLALNRGIWSLFSQHRVLKVLVQAGLPIHFPNLSVKEKQVFWAALSKDKKNIGGTLRFVLPRKMGSVMVQSGIAISEVKKAITTKELK